MRVQEILSNLNHEQLEAVTTKEHPLVIIAGAGSGKTRVLTRRIAYRIATGDADARHTLAVTFTKKAASELKQRLQSLEMRDQIEAQTFHAAALRILQRYWESKEMVPYQLLESKSKIITESIARIGARAKTQNANNGWSRSESQTESEVARRSLISSVSAEIEWAKARGLTPSEYSDTAVALDRNIPLTPSEMAEVFLNYEEIKSRFRKLDYDDLIIRATQVLLGDRAFQSTERYRMRHLYIDEFQDINAVQMNLVNALLGDRTDLCVVGDPHQAIYSWNGADPTLITSLPTRYESARTVVLAHNYRSTPQILSLARSVLNKQNKISHYEKGLLPNLPDGPVPVIRAFNDDTAEAQSVARLIKQARQPGTSWRDIAVLARTNAQLIPIQRTFKEMGIPSFLASETSYLAQSEVRTILASLEQGSILLAGTSLYAWLEETVEKTLHNHSSTGPAFENLNLFLELAREHLSSSPKSDSRSLALWLKSEARNAANESAADTVNLTTFHRAKGLEWRTVFIVGMEDGLVPIARAETREALLEEQRLLYVAITRAKSQITLTWAKHRSFNTRQLKREPSPYLAGLQDEADRLSGHVATSDHALTAIRRARNVLKQAEHKISLTDKQQAIVASLRLWRSKKSKELGVPAHIILHDHALASVAIQKPATIEELSKIAGIGSTKASRFGAELLKHLTA